MTITTTITHRAILSRLFRIWLLAAVLMIQSVSLGVMAQGLPLIKNFTAADYGGYNRNFDIEIGNDGTVFVANFGGLLYYDRAQWHMIHTPDSNRVTLLYRDASNSIWIGGYRFMAHLHKKANGELFMQMVTEQDEIQGDVMEIYEDHGSLHFFASDNNIYEVRDDKVILKRHTKANFQTRLEHTAVSISALKKGYANVLLDDITQTVKLDGGLQVQVRKNNGLAITDDQGRQLYTITQANGLCSDKVACVAYDGHGVLWGATEHGIFAIELPSVYTYLLQKDGIMGEIRSIAAFDGKIYIGDTNGIFCVESRQAKQVVNTICWDMSTSPDGLLAATSNGIYRIGENSTLRQLTTTSTTSLMVDGDMVYAGEPDGVYLYQKGFRHRELAYELPLATEILKDSLRGMWLKNVHGETIGEYPGQPHSIIADLPKSLTAPIKLRKVTAQYRDGDHVWIGGDEKLTIIDLSRSDLAKLSDCRTIRFRSIILDGDSVLWGGYGNMPEKPFQLDSHERHLVFFYALDFVPLTGKAHYRYRLNDGKWSDWSKSKSVEFLNQPYGSYILSVQAKLANGELSDVASVRFHIAFPLPLRWYMLVLYLLGIVYIVYLLFRYRLKKLERDKIKLEQIVEERTADLRKAQHELIRQEKMASVVKLTAGLIDRILNPMNYIINFSKMSVDLLKDLKANFENNKDKMDPDDYDDSEDIMGMLTQNLHDIDLHGQNATRTLKSMEEMLNDRAGGYTDTDLLPILRQSEEMFRTNFAKEIAQAGIKPVFTFPDKPMPINGNPELLCRTIMNILGNAVYATVKKAATDPVIQFSATESDGQYILKIRDNGIGIDQDLLDKIFDPFFTTKTTGEASGVGLYLSREIIQNHGGDITVTSAINEFTEFTITLPAAPAS